MTRRTIRLPVIFILAILAAPLAADAQAPAKVPRIGWLASGFPPSEAIRQRSPFFQALRAKPDRIHELAAELVQLRVDVIVAGDLAAIRAAKPVTSTIPIVTTVSGDPVRAGYVASLARPGGNITGLSNLTPQLAGQRLEFLTEVLPQLSRLAVLGPPGAPDWPELTAATQAVGVQLLALKVHRPEEFGGAFEAAVSESTEALVVLLPPLTNRYWSLLAAQHRLGGAASAWRRSTACQPCIP